MSRTVDAGRIVAVKKSAPRSYAVWLTKNWTGRAALAILFWTSIGFIFALPSLAEGGGRVPVISSLLEWWSWGLMTPLILSCRPPAADSRQAACAARVGARVCGHLFHCGVSLSFLRRPSGSRHRPVVRFARLSFFCLVATGDVFVELLDLLGNCGRAAGLPVLRALRGERAAAGAVGAQHQRGAAECAAHAA